MAKNKTPVCVIPRRDGLWEVRSMTHRQYRAWERQWSAWWQAEGMALEKAHPDWWPRGFGRFPPADLPSTFRSGSENPKSGPDEASAK